MEREEGGERRGRWRGRGGEEEGKKKVYNQRELRNRKVRRLKQRKMKVRREKMMSKLRMKKWKKTVQNRINGK